jgi:hypothetical protein
VAVVVEVGNFMIQELQKNYFFLIFFKIILIILSYFRSLCYVPFVGIILFFLLALYTKIQDIPSLEPIIYNFFSLFMTPSNKTYHFNETTLLKIINNIIYFIGLFLYIIELLIKKKIKTTPIKISFYTILASAIVLLITFFLIIHNNPKGPTEFPILFFVIFIFTTISLLTSMVLTLIIRKCNLLLNNLQIKNP